MKNFVKALKPDGEGFLYLKQMWTKLSEAKIKEGIFVGPQIRQVFNDKKFEDKLSEVEAAAWVAFTEVCENFLGNYKSDNYEHIVNHLIDTYSDMGCNMSLKIHYLHSHLDFFPNNLSGVSD